MREEQRVVKKQTTNNIKKPQTITKTKTKKRIPPPTILRVSFCSLMSKMNRNIFVLPSASICDHFAIF